MQSKTTTEQKPPSRFALFVRLATGVVSTFPDRDRLWTFRGDKFTDDPAKQLKNLLNHLKKNVDRYHLFELYDNEFSSDHDNRIVVKYNAGTVEINRLQHYSNYTAGLLIADFLKP